MLSAKERDNIKKLLQHLNNEDLRDETLSRIKEAHEDQDWADAENPADERRPVQDRKPMPWIGGLGPVLNLFKIIDPIRARKAEEQRLCIMCGLPLGKTYVYSNLDGRSHDFREFFGAPTPTFVHPRCALKAAAFCPHLQRQPFPAVDRNGKGITHDELRKLSNAHDQHKSHSTTGS